MLTLLVWNKRLTTYENIDEAYETAGTAMTTKPIPQRSYGMFQYIKIVSVL